MHAYCMHVVSRQVATALITKVHGWRDSSTAPFDFAKATGKPHSWRLHAPTAARKVCPERIYSMAMHPANQSDALLVVAGDKMGCLGLFDVSRSIATASASSSAASSASGSAPQDVFRFYSHTRAVSDVVFDRQARIVSSSYDGSVRILDLAAGGRSTELYVHPDECTLHGLCPADPDEQVWYICDVQGGLCVMDTRLGPQGNAKNIKNLSDLKLCTVDVHPTGTPTGTGFFTRSSFACGVSLSDDGVGVCMACRRACLCA
jgi:WD40 repeat protein